MKNLVLLNYANRKAETSVDLYNLENIEFIRITVLSGDEVADVLYTNGALETYDSAVLLKEPRTAGYYDGSYVIYDKSRNIDFLDIFPARKNSYWR